MVLGGQSTPSIGPMSPPAVLADCVVSGGSVTLSSPSLLSTEGEVGSPLTSRWLTSRPSGEAGERLAALGLMVMARGVSPLAVCLMS